MASLLRTLLATSALALAFSGGAQAAGGHYRLDGGSRAEQSQVKQALNASSFNWSVVPATITVHIARGHYSEATYGEIWLDADLLDSGIFSWGVVQHEYAHQVDFFLLNDTRRAMLAGLGGQAWWATGATASGAPNGTLAHADLTSERFASTLAWAYWPSPSNSMRPTSTSDESAAMAPAAFRSLLARVLAAR